MSTLTSLPCACTALRKSGRAISRAYDEALAPSGLRVTQYALLSTISRTGAISVTDLAEELALDRTTLTRNFGPLERWGYLKIEAGDDRRVRRASLTEVGLTKLNESRPLWRAAQDRVINEFGADRLANLIVELSAISQTVHVTSEETQETTRP